MPLSPASAPSDLSDLIVNASVFFAAAAASLGGIRMGLRKAKKLLEADDDKGDGTGHKKQVLSAAIMETVSIREWSEQNRLSTEQTRLLCSHLDQVVDELRDTRGVNRDLADEIRKLRLATDDLASTNRAFNR